MTERHEEKRSLREAQKPRMTYGDGSRKSTTSGRNASRTAARKAAISTANEVKELRSEAQRLDEQFSALCAKWKAALPERDVLLAACTAAKQKAVTDRVEQLNIQLKDELLQQQLYFSALQQKLTEAPLWSRSVLCQELFDRMHSYLHLVGSDLESRRKQLEARFEFGIRIAPELVENFTREFLPLASHVLPFSRTSTAATIIPCPLHAQGGLNEEREGDVCGTLVSNVFVCKLSAGVNIPRIYQSVVDNIKNNSIHLECRLNVLLDFKVQTILFPSDVSLYVVVGSWAIGRVDVLTIQLLFYLLQYEFEMGPYTYYARVERQDGEMRGAHTNRAWTGRLVSDDLAVVLTDFVDVDDEEATDEFREEGQDIQVGSDGVPLILPTSMSGIRIDVCMMLTISRVKDPKSQETYVLLRRLRVHRYNLPPNSPLIYRELKKLVSYFSGDFHMAMLSDAYTKTSNEDHPFIAGSESFLSARNDRRDGETET
ncbi:unnamed protein product [Peronospora belbahrii]|uniref:Uncharacterized protein n=1 Tax=Peronospora belbahrii TaxID=622444 RepID=A0AAU9KV74_9STRA|nr:unnamed protein product [Peronospora belbahrii]